MAPMDAELRCYLPPTANTLRTTGFLIFPSLISTARVATFNERIEALFAQEGDDAGSEFKTEPGAHRQRDR